MSANELLFSHLLLLLCLQKVFFKCKNSISADVGTSRDPQFIRNFYLSNLSRFLFLMRQCKETFSSKGSCLYRNIPWIIHLKHVSYHYHTRDCKYPERLLLPWLIVSGSKVVCVVWPYEMAIQSLVWKCILGSFI